MMKIIKKVSRICKRITKIPINYYGFIRKDFVTLTKKRKYLFLSIALPLIIGLIYILTLTGGTSNINVYVCDFDNTKLTQQAITSLQDFKIKTTDDTTKCLDTLKKEVEEHKSLFGIIINEDFTKNLENLQQSKIEIYYDNSEASISTLAEWRIDASLIKFKNELIYSLSNEIKSKSNNAKKNTEIALEITKEFNIKSLNNKVKEIDDDLKRVSSIDPDFMASPIKTEKKGIYKNFKMLDLGLAPLFVILNLFMILMLCSTSVIYERKVKILERIRASSASIITYIISKLTFYLIISICQFIILLLIFLAFGASYTLSPLILIKGVLLISLINSLIGILIGIISDSEGIAVLMSLIITLPMFFLSGMFYPLQLMPKIIQVFTKIIPIENQILIMKNGLILGGGINNQIFFIPLILFIISIIILKKIN